MMGWRDCSTSPFTLSSLLWPSLPSSALCPVPGGASPGESVNMCVYMCISAVIFAAISYQCLRHCYFHPLTLICINFELQSINTAKSSKRMRLCKTA